MGTTGTALFADDVACDVRDEWIAHLCAGVEPLQATKAVLESSRELLQDVDDAPVVWLALAATQWKYGSLDDRVRDEAIRVIDSGAGSARWTAAGAIRRQKVLKKLREQLHSPQPAPRRPRRRAMPVIPKIEAWASDGSAKAVS